MACTLCPIAVLQSLQQCCRPTPRGHPGLAPLQCHRCITMPLGPLHQCCHCTPVHLIPALWAQSVTEATEEYLIPAPHTDTHEQCTLWVPLGAGLRSGRRLSEGMSLRVPGGRIVASFRIPKGEAACQESPGCTVPGGESRLMRPCHT